MRVLSTTIFLCLMAGAIAAGSAFARQAEALDWSETLTEGQVLEIRGVSSDIRIARSGSASTRVVATRTGRASDFDQIDVRVVEDDTRVVICVFYAWWTEGRDACDQRGEREARCRKVRAGVDFEVQLAAGVELEANTISGDVTGQALRSDVRAASVSGNVRVSTSGVVRATTVSGDLDLEMGSLDWERLDFSTVSGDIDLTLPSGLAAKVYYQSVSGDLDTDFEMTLPAGSSRRWFGANVEGRIGDGGGRRLDVQTVSGDLRLRRR